MIIRKAGKLYPKGIGQTQAKLRTLSVLQNYCIPVDVNWKQLQLCKCSVCQYKQNLQKTQKLRQSEIFNPQALQKLLKLMCFQQYQKQQAKIQLKISETCFFANGKFSSYFLNQGSKIRYRYRISNKQLTQNMLKSNKTGLWLFVDIQKNLRILCKNQFYYLLRPGSKTKPLKIALSLQNYIDSDQQKAVITIQFAYSMELQNNQLFKKAKYQVVFFQKTGKQIDQSDIPLYYAYKIFHYALKQKKTRIVKGVYNFSRNEQNQVYLLSCTQLITERCLPQISTKQQIRNIPANKMVANQIERLYQQQKQSIIQLSEMRVAKYFKQSAQVYSQLYGGSQQQYKGLLQRDDFYQATSKMLKRKHSRLSSYNNKGLNRK